jgi:putative transposase
VVYRLHAHIVLTPKYRRKVMTDRVMVVLRDAFTEVCARHHATLDAFETDTDHAHLQVSYPPKLALSVLVMSLKTISSHRVRQRHWPEVARALRGAHFWSPSYAVVSCGATPLDIVRAYVENQKSPNRKPGRPRKPRALDPSLTEEGCAPVLLTGRSAPSFPVAEGRA